jgi:hypothetical protein
MAILQEILCLVAQNGSQRHREITTFFGMVQVHLLVQQPYPYRGVTHTSKE